MTCPIDCVPQTCGDGACTRAERFYCIIDCGTTCGDAACQITDIFLCPDECFLGGGGLPIPLGAPGTPVPAPAP
jgi:hypothetical protein